MKKLITFLLLLTSLSSISQSTSLVISQAYGGGGNTGAPLNADFVELHNISGSSQSTAGLSIQYSSATNTGLWTGVFALPAATIPAGGYYLIRMSVVGTIGVALPTPDATTPTGSEIAMSASNGKVALVNGVTALTGCPATGIVDLVGYGTANCFETAATAALTNTMAALRKNNGCTETNSNLADFTVAAPAPRNSSSPVFACGAISATLSVTTVVDFGNVMVGSNSTSQSYQLSGASLTGAPGTITVSAPSTDFQVSNDNTTWGATTLIAYTSATLASTSVWVRFTPQSAGPKSGNVTNTGGGAATVNVPVSGNGVAPITPVISASTLAAFGNVCINTTAGPNSFTLNGINLPASPITVGPLAGFTFSTTATGTYTPTLILTQSGGTYTQEIFVNFTPIAIQSYDGMIDIVITGAMPITVAASGSGANNPPIVITGAASLITNTSATLAGSIGSNGCSAITGYGIEYSLISGFVMGTVVSSSNISSGAFSSAVSGLNAATTYYYKAYAINGGGTAYGAELSFTTASPLLTATQLNSFGNVCVGTTTDPNNFTITSPGLGTSNVTVGPLNGYTFSTSAGGPYTVSLDIAQPGGAFTQTIFVRFTPVAFQSYNGNIPVSGGGASTLLIPATGIGNNSAPDVTTGLANVSPLNIVFLPGTVTGTGCSPLTSYGIEYSGINGFGNGNGTKIESFNLSNSDFSITANSFVQGTTYYYKAYAVNSGGVAYGDQQSFKTDSLASGFVIYSSPVSRGGELHYSVNNIKPGHYQARIFNTSGQMIYRKDMILQVNFIDDRIILPPTFGIGVYYLQLYNFEFRETKYFMVQ